LNCWTNSNRRCAFSDPETTKIRGVEMKWLCDWHGAKSNRTSNEEKIHTVQAHILHGRHQLIKEGRC
jgi:hypothetical protein